MNLLGVLETNFYVAAGLDPVPHIIDGHVSFIPHSLHVLGLTKQAFMFMLAGVLTLLLFWGYSRKAGRQSVPSRYGNFVETMILFLRDQLIRPFMGESGDRYLPVIVTFFTYILICNLLGLIPVFDYLGHGSNTATGNICITAGLAVCAFVFYHSQGIREQGGIGVYVKNLFPHVPVFVLPIIVVIEIIAHLIRPFALAVRLFANMLAGHAMIAALLGFTIFFTSESTASLLGGGAISVVSVLAVTALTFLELLVAVIQAFVFAFLTTVFLAGAVHPEH